MFTEQPKKKAIKIPIIMLVIELKIKLKFISIKKFLITSSHKIANKPITV